MKTRKRPLEARALRRFITWAAHPLLPEEEAFLDRQDKRFDRIQLLAFYTGYRMGLREGRR